jgi:hydroxymethylbilane synthase
VPMATAGDRGASPDGSAGGVKGLFVAEIERALLEGHVDVAVHSAKDLPSEDPDGIVVAAVPERADPFDVLVTNVGGLRPSAVVGTSSLRRRAQLARSRPDVIVREIRGNVDTRIRKLQRGELDGLVLAAAGLARLGLEVPSAVPFPLDEMVPAPGQGCLAVQARRDDQATLEVCRALDHEASRASFEAERRLMDLLGGGCALPLGAYAERREGGVRLLAIVVRPDGSDLLWAQAEADGPEAVAQAVAGILLDAGAGAILAAVRP